MAERLVRELRRNAFIKSDVEARRRAVGVLAWMSSFAVAALFVTIGCALLLLLVAHRWRQWSNTPCCGARACVQIPNK